MDGCIKIDNNMKRGNKYTFVMAVCDQTLPLLKDIVNDKYILLIMDDNDVRIQLLKVLTACDCNVLSSNTVEEARMYIDVKKYNIEYIIGDTRNDDIASFMKESTDIKLVGYKRSVWDIKCIQDTSRESITKGFMNL
ncbi:hypothetical protein SAGO17_0078 [Mimivirus AB-566-O17]|uniref:Uncharacterized protein n=1 Tax=Mimivirus AB-566-O17 TaxID=1988039 RepID=A0A1X9VNV4_9VIRU|nr:hypothetical protein SAGO17_0078 [Mimivirus AB-566-O17]